MAGVLTGKFESVKLLLEMGADVTIAEKDGYTPMHGAGFQGRDKIAQLLIDHGIDPNHIHKDGFDPIHRACWGMKMSHAETVRVFLNAGVPVDFKSGDGKTPKELARSMLTINVIDEFLASKPKNEL